MSVLSLDPIAEQRRILDARDGVTTRFSWLTGQAEPIPAPGQVCAECAEPVTVVYAVQCPSGDCDVELCLPCADGHGYPID